MTAGKWDEALPSWSPDGSRIAFMSNHGEDPDREPSAQVFVSDAKPEATEKQLTSSTNRGGRSRPEWSPDGKWIAFLEGDEKKFGAYSISHLALVPSDGSAAPARVQAVEALDRGVYLPRFNADGKSINFLVTDDRSVYSAKVNLATGNVERLLAPPIVVSNWDSAAAHLVVLSGGDTKLI